MFVIRFHITTPNIKVCPRDSKLELNGIDIPILKGQLKFNSRYTHYEQRTISVENKRKSMGNN